MSGCVILPVGPSQQPRHDSTRQMYHMYIGQEEREREHHTRGRRGQWDRDWSLGPSRLHHWRLPDVIITLLCHASIMQTLPRQPHIYLYIDYTERERERRNCKGWHFAFPPLSESSSKRALATHSSKVKSDHARWSCSVCIPNLFNSYKFLCGLMTWNETEFAREQAKRKKPFRIGFDYFLLLFAHALADTSVGQFFF